MTLNKIRTITGGCCQWRDSASYDSDVLFETFVLRRKLSGEIATEQQPPAVSLQLFDIYGNLLKSVTITGNATTMDISGYPAEIYIVRFMDKKGVVAKEIIKR